VIQLARSMVSGQRLASSQAFWLLQTCSIGSGRGRSRGVARLVASLSCVAILTLIFRLRCEGDERAHFVHYAYVSERAT
jgi:hypothetical protein